MTPEDILALRHVGAPAIAPGGDLVAFTVSAWEHMCDCEGTSAGGGSGATRPVMRSHIWVVPAAGGEARRLTDADHGGSRPGWSPDGRYLAFLSSRTGAGSESRGAQLWLQSIAGGEARQLTHGRESVSDFSWSHNGSRIAYIMHDTVPAVEERRRARGDDPAEYEGDFRQSHVWIVNIATGEAHEAAHGAFTVGGAPSWSPDDERIAFGAAPTPLVHDLRGSIYTLTLATGALKKVAPAPRSTVTRLAEPLWSPDGETLAFAAMPLRSLDTTTGVTERDFVNERLVLYDMRTETSREVGGPAFDVQRYYDLSWTPDGRQLLFSTTDRASRAIWRYDLRSGAISAVARDVMFAGLSYDRSGARVAFVRETSTSPADIYISDTSFAAPRRLTDVNPQVRTFALGETRVIRWVSTDGTPVEGLLLEPVGYRVGERYPLLVEPHGGPTSVTSNGFKAHWLSPGQFWAGRGWAVFYPNARGSIGYGEAFMRANIADWGGGDYQDIMSGVDTLIALGVADSTRLAIEGWSYGGYMAAWAVSQSTRFKAAHMGAGISNLRTMYGVSEIPGYIRAFFGGIPGEETQRLYDERSPISHVDQVLTPLLMLQGAEDTRVPIGQSMEYYRALRDRSKTVRLVFYPREGHSLREYYHQLDKIHREYDWISRYTPRGSPANNTPRQ